MSTVLADKVCFGYFCGTLARFVTIQLATGKIWRRQAPIGFAISIRAFAAWFGSIHRDDHFFDEKLLQSTSCRAIIGHKEI